MSGAAKVNFKINNQTETVGKAPQGTVFVSGESVRGPYNSPDEIINSWPKYVAKYGGYMSNNDTPLLVKRLLDAGASIRFNKIGHYADIADANTLDATKATIITTTALSFDGPFLVDNSIVLTLNGTDLDPVDYVLSSDNTLALLADEIATHTDVDYTQVVSIPGGDDNDRKILITPKSGGSINITAVTITGGSSQPVETITQVVGIIDTYTDTTLFSLVPKYEGADYNNLAVSITAGSNGLPGYFNLKIYHKTESNIVESFTNLYISGNPSIPDSNYLSRVETSSQYINIIYNDLSSTTGTLVPAPITIGFSGGTNGSTPNDTDYIGDSAAANGFYAFNQYEGTYYLAVLPEVGDSVHVAGINYAKKRGDLVYMMHFNNGKKTKTQLINARKALNVDTKFVHFSAGGIKIVDPTTNSPKNISGIADVIGLAVNTDKNFGEWYSFAGPNRGIIGNALGVVNNFGGPASMADLDELANNHINMIINRNNKIMLWGNFSGQYKNDQERFISIVKLILFLKKSLRPTLEGYIEEPNDIPTWKRLYYTVKPFLDSLVTNRALYEYSWDGDQFANNINELQVNNGSDVSEGKYKIIFNIKAIPSIQEINIEITLSPAGMDFKVLSNLN